MDGYTIHFTSGLSEVMTEGAQWSEETFGHATPSSIAKHLLKEAQELVDNPTDGEEMADIMLLLGHLFAVTDKDPVYEVRRKLEICRQRKWGPPDADGVVEHIRG